MSFITTNRSSVAIASVNTVQLTVKLIQASSPQVGLLVCGARDGDQLSKSDLQSMRGRKLDYELPGDEKLHHSSRPNQLQRDVRLLCGGWRCVGANGRSTHSGNERQNCPTDQGSVLLEKVLKL